jgi:hypothetical protein
MIRTTARAAVIEVGVWRGFIRSEEVGAMGGLWSYASRERSGIVRFRRCREVALGRDFVKFFSGWTDGPRIDAPRFRFSLRGNRV